MNQFLSADFQLRFHRRQQAAQGFQQVDHDGRQLRQRPLPVCFPPPLPLLVTAAVGRMTTPLRGQPLLFLLQTFPLAREAALLLLHLGGNAHHTKRGDFGDCQYSARCIELIPLRGKKKPAWRNQTPSGLFIPPNNANNLHPSEIARNRGWSALPHQGKADWPLKKALGAHLTF
jgi:hypothetical protein